MKPTVLYVPTAATGTTVHPTDDWNIKNWRKTDAENAKCAERNLSQRHDVHHKLHRVHGERTRTFAITEQATNRLSYDKAYH